jgi:tetratricopeptide (TPR) repeat protein
MITTASITGMFVAIGLAYSVYLNLTAIPPVEIDPISVLIADFDNQTGNPLFDGSIEETLNTGIEGAAFITAFNRSAAQSQIDKLRPGSKLDEEGARLIAVREGVKLVLTGLIAEENGRYQLSVHAIEPQSGEVVAEADERANDEARVLLAVTALAGEIREELGDTSLEDESLRAAETFTAGSLQAAKDYNQAQNLAYLGSYEESLEYYQRAVDSYPQFGRAYSGWALATFNLGRNDEADELWQKALSLMETMTERERYRTLGLYYMAVSKNYRKAIESYESLVQKFPADGAGHNNLAVAYFSTLNFERAMQEGLRVLEIYPSSIFYKQNFALYAMYAGEFELAEARGREVIDQDATRHYAWLPIAAAAMSGGDLSEAELSYRSMAATGARGESQANLGLADIELYRGQYAAAVELLHSGIAADIEAGNQRATATKYIALAEAHTELGDTEASMQAISEALSAGGGLARQVPAALLHLWHGHTDLAAEIGNELSQQLQPQSRAYGNMILGVIDSRAGRHVDALDKLTSAIELSDFWLVRFYLGQAYLAAGSHAEALDEFDICHSRRGEASAIFLDDLPTWRYLATLPYWQGRAQQELGMVSAALLSYGAYLELRPDSDPLADDARQRMP